MHLIALLADDPGLTHALRAYREPSAAFHLHPVPQRSPEATLAALEALDFAGALVLDEEAQRVAYGVAARRSLDASVVGAADTLTVTPGGLIADYNLGRAVGGCLRGAGWNARDASTVVIGSGTAARAVAKELSSLGVRALTVLARSRPAAEGVLVGMAATTEVAATALEDPLAANYLAAADLLVRVDSAGSVPWSLLGPHLTLVDLDPEPVSPLRQQAIAVGALSFNRRDVIARLIAVALGNILGGQVAVEGLLELLHRHVP